MSTAGESVPAQDLKRLWNGSPFDAEAARAESTLCILAAGALHPTPAVRESCRGVVAGHLGTAALSEAAAQARAALACHADDVLEPLTLEDGDHWLIAALQLLRPRVRPKDQSPLRVSSLDAIGVGGGVELRGVESAVPVRRRNAHGEWSDPRGAAYHPALLRAWVSRATEARRVRAELKGDSDGVKLEIPHEATGIDRIRDILEGNLGHSAPEWFRHWLVAGASSPRPSRAARGAATADTSLIASAQEHSRFTADHAPLSKAGGHVVGLTKSMQIRFKTPESVIRFSAAALVQGLVEIAAIRPLGWLVLGQGPDQVDFVRAINALPPDWLQVGPLPRLVPPPELVRPLAEWLGPCVGLADFALLDALHG